MKEHRLDLHSIIYSNILNSTISIDSLVNFYWLLLKVQNIASEFTYCAKCYGGICRKQGKTIGKNLSKTSKDHVSVVQVRDVLENFETFVSIKVCGKQMGVNSPRWRLTKQFTGASTLLWKQQSRARHCSFVMFTQPHSILAGISCELQLPKFVEKDIVFSFFFPVVMSIEFCGSCFSVSSYILSQNRFSLQ